MRVIKFIVILAILQFFFLQASTQADFVGKTYIGIVSNLCKEATGGGCDIYLLYTISFFKDSATVIEETKPSCSNLNEDIYKYKKSKVVKWEFTNNELNFKYGNIEKLFFEDNLFKDNNEVEYKQLVDSIKYEEVCGDAGAGESVKITQDSLFYTSFLRGNIVTNSSVQIPNDLFIHLLRATNIDSFKIIPNGGCYTCFDGCDINLFFYSHTKMWQSYNGSGKYFDELLAVINSIINYAKQFTKKEE